MALAVVDDRELATFDLALLLEKFANGEDLLPTLD
jgi:hypothetical protein